jgi:rod shape-determining protein MreD
VGPASVNYLGGGALILAVYLACYLAACHTPLSDWLGVQIDLRPALMVYCGLRTEWATLASVAVLGGFWFDALSANLLGISILPLFLVAFVVHVNRSLILREQRYAQFVLGAAASAVAPMLTALLLFGAGQMPLVGWGSVWQWLILALAGGGLTPVLFWLFERFHRACTFQAVTESSFRPDRQIKRGRI